MDLTSKVACGIYLEKVTWNSHFTYFLKTFHTTYNGFFHWHELLTESDSAWKLVYDNENSYLCLKLRKVGKDGDTRPHTPFGAESVRGSAISNIYGSYAESNRYSCLWKSLKSANLPLQRIFWFTGEIGNFPYIHVVVLMWLDVGWKKMAALITGEEV